MSVFGGLVIRDLVLALRQRSEIVTLLAFFILSAILFPFGVGPDPDILARISAGIIWVTALLAALLSLERLYNPDFEDGSLELLVLLPIPLELITLAKALVHWLTTGLPLLAVTPLLALFLYMPLSSLPMLLLAMALGTGSFSLMGGIGAALTLGARRGGVLIALLLLPLCIPILILGIAAIEAAQAGLSARVPLLMLGAILSVCLAISPFVTAAVLRQALH